MKRILWIVAIAFGLVSCSPILESVSTPTSLNLPTPTIEPLNSNTQRPTSQQNMENTSTPSNNTPNFPPELEGLIDLAENDLSQRISIDKDQIKLQEVLEMTWRNSGLGCGKPGSNYLQVITPGYLLRFSANNQIYEYHTDKNSVVIFCSNPGTIDSGTVDH